MEKRTSSSTDDLKSTGRSKLRTLSLLGLDAFNDFRKDISLRKMFNKIHRSKGSNLNRKNSRSMWSIDESDFENEHEEADQFKNKPYLQQGRPFSTPEFGPVAYNLKLLQDKREFDLQGLNSNCMSSIYDLNGPGYKNKTKPENRIKLDIRDNQKTNTELSDSISTDQLYDYHNYQDSTVPVNEIKCDPIMLHDSKNEINPNISTLQVEKNLEDTGFNKDELLRRVNKRSDKLQNDVLRMIMDKNCSTKELLCLYVDLVASHRFIFRSDDGVESDESVDSNNSNDTIINEDILEYGFVNLIEEDVEERIITDV